MPMFDSDEAFEAYVAQQQAELAGETPDAEPQAAAPKPSKGPLERCTTLLTVLVPLGLIILGGAFVWNNAPDRSRVSHDPWDNILGTAAWATGREYNADADTLTERLTLRKPGDTRGDR